MKTALATAIVLTGLVSGSAAARADTIIDPSTLHIGTGVGTPGYAGGGTYIYQGHEVNNLGNGSTFDMYQNSSGAGAEMNPLLLIVGVADTTVNGQLVHGAAPVLAGTAGWYDPATGHISGTVNVTGGVGAWGLSGQAGSTSLVGTMSSGNELYSFLGAHSSGIGTELFNGGGVNSSNSFTNWAAADQAVDGITATGFDIYVFQIQTSQFVANDAINFTNAVIGQGAFIAGFGAENDGNNTYTVYDSPFTEIGGVTSSTPPPPGPPTTGNPVPEPSSIAVLALGALGLAGRAAGRRRPR
jgi:hypothetical protein